MGASAVIATDVPSGEGAHTGGGCGCERVGGYEKSLYLPLNFEPKTFSKKWSSLKK